MIVGETERRKDRGLDRRLRAVRTRSKPTDRSERVDSQCGRGAGEAGILRGDRGRDRFRPNLPKIEADHAQLQEVFVNLMSNGVDAMPEGGDVDVAHVGRSEWHGHCRGV